MREAIAPATNASGITARARKRSRFLRAGIASRARFRLRETTGRRLSDRKDVIHDLMQSERQRSGQCGQDHGDPARADFQNVNANGSDEADRCRRKQRAAFDESLQVPLLRACARLEPGVAQLEFEVAGTHAEERVPSPERPGGAPELVSRSHAARVVGPSSVKRKIASECAIPTAAAAPATPPAIIGPIAASAARPRKASNTAATIASAAIPAREIVSTVANVQIARRAHSNGTDARRSTSRGLRRRFQNRRPVGWTLERSAMRGTTVAPT